MSHSSVRRIRTTNQLGDLRLYVVSCYGHAPSPPGQSVPTSILVEGSQAMIPSRRERVGIRLRWCGRRPMRTAYVGRHASQSEAVPRLGGRRIMLVGRHQERCGLHCPRQKTNPVAPICSCADPCARKPEPRAQRLSCQQHCPRGELTLRL